VKRENKWCLLVPGSLYKCYDEFIDNFKKVMEKLYKEQEPKGWSLVGNSGYVN
jgi:hypothetical protein